MPGTSGTDRSPLKHQKQKTPNQTSDEQVVTSEFDIVEPRPHVTMRKRKTSRQDGSGEDTETWREKIKEEKEEDELN